jgi:hypothetical protein
MEKFNIQKIIEYYSPNTEELGRVKEKLKDDMMKSNKDVNYLKIVNKNNMTFFKFLEECKEQYLSGKNRQIYMV